MDPSEAIADLKELSTQIETVVLASREGEVVAASAPAGSAGTIGLAARSLVDAAEAVRRDLGRDALAQVQAATPEGSVFVVVDAQRMAVATTGVDPTVGLVFYDLKTLLRQTGDAPVAAPGEEEPDDQA